MTFITGLCAMSAPTLLGYDSINPEIVRLAGSSVGGRGVPAGARGAAVHHPRDVHDHPADRSLRPTSARGITSPSPRRRRSCQKQKITNPVANVLAHIYAYVLFIIYMTPVVMIVIFSFQTYSAMRMQEARSFASGRSLTTSVSRTMSTSPTAASYKMREGSISGLFANEATLGGIQLSFVLSVIAAALACVIVVVACNYIFKNKSKKSGTILEYCLLFPWLLPTILICYSYRTYFNSEQRLVCVRQHEPVLCARTCGC